MNCRKARRLLVLEAGSDLPEKPKEKLKLHLQACPRCQREEALTRRIVLETRECLNKERLDWKESEWKKTIQEAVKEAEIKKNWLVPWSLRREWAFVLMTASVILLSLLVLHPSFVKDRMKRVPDVSAISSQPEIVSMKLVSKETGLEINWFFHKDLKLEVME